MSETSSFILGLIFLLFVLSTCAVAIVVWARKQVPVDLSTNPRPLLPEIPALVRERFGLSAEIGPNCPQIYALARERSAHVVASFRNEIIPGFVEAASDYVFPQFGDKPVCVCDAADEVIDILMAHPDEPYSLYWTNPNENEDVNLGMLFFTSDGELVLGLSLKTLDREVISKHRHRLKSILDIRCDYVDYSDGLPPQTAEAFLKEMGLLSSVQTLPPRTSPVDEHTKRLVSSVVNAGQKYLEGATSYSEFSLDVGGNLRALEGLSQSEKDALFYLECHVEDADFLLNDEELHDLVQEVIYQLKEHFGV